MSSPLSLEAILQAMADAVPTHKRGDTTSDLSSSYEVLALLVHGYLTNLKFRLIGFEEDKNIGASHRQFPPPCPSPGVRVPRDGVQD